jgi:hypothetical protein
VTLWALVFVVVGLGLSVYGGNAALAAKLDDHPAIPTRSGRAAVAGRKAMLRVGMVMVALGVAMFVLGIIIHTVLAVMSILVLVGGVVAVLWVLSLLRGSRARRSD